MVKVTHYDSYELPNITFYLSVFHLLNIFLASTIAMGIKRMIKAGQRTRLCWFWTNLLTVFDLFGGGQ